MAERYAIILDKQGNPVRKEGKAAPELLRSDLRRLPGDLVTKEVGDGEKIHELDEEHTRLALIQEHDKKLQGKEPEQEEEAGAPAALRDEERLLTQERIDIIRLRVMRAIAKNAQTPEEKLALRHVWFPRNDINAYSLRDGNAPGDADRPKHLRRFKLEIDLASGRLPETVVDRLPLRKRMQYSEHIKRLQTGYYARKARQADSPISIPRMRWRP